MATTIQLQLTLDSSGALTGVTQLGEKLKSLQPPKAVADQFERGHAAAKLFKEITGGELPDALDELIGKTKTLGPLLEAAFSAVPYVKAGIAVLEFGQTAVKGIKFLMDALDPAGARLDRLYQETVNASQDAFWNPKTLEAAKSHMAELKQQIEALNKEIENPDTSNLPMYGGGEELAGIVASNGALIKQNELLDKKEELQKIQNKLQAEMNVLTAEVSAKEMTAGKQGLALIQAQYDAQVKLAQAKLSADPAHDQEKYKLDIRTAEAEKLNATMQLQRQSAEQTIALRHQVKEDALQGAARIRQVEIDAIEDVNRKERETVITHKDAVAQRKLIHQRADQDIARAKEQMAEETQAMEDQARDAQLQGDDLLYAHQEEQVTKQRNLYAKGLIDWDNYQERVRAIDEMTQAQIRKNAEETAKRKADILGKQKDAENAIALTTMSEWDRAFAQIAFDSEKSIRAIDQQEKDLLKQYKGDQDMIVMITASAQAQRQAVWTQADERIRQEHKRHVEQLGSDLESMFDDISNGKIGERILKNIKKFFFQIVAAFLEATGFMKTTWGKIFGTLMGGPGSSLEQSSGGGLGSILGLFSGQSATLPGTAAAATAAAGFLPAPSSIDGSTTSSASAGGLAASSAVTGSANTGLGQSSIGQGILNLFGGNNSSTGGLTLSKLGTNLKSLFTVPNVVAMGTMGLSLGAGLIGGKLGQVGGMLSALTLMAQANPGGPAAMLLSHFGLMSGLAGTIFASFGPALIGFGVGTHFGPLGGALAGGATGFGVGALIGLAGGPIGALIGGIVGAIAGLFGGLFGSGKRKRQANAFANNTVLPAVNQIEDQYKNFSLDYTSAIGQLEDLRKQAQDQLGKLKGEGRNVMKNVVTPAIDHAEADINGFEAERQRRSALTFGPPEFHTGGFVDTMTRSFTSRPGDLLAVLKRGEFVVNPQATAKNRRTLEAINAGSSAALSVGEIHIHPTTLDRAYVRTGFKQDLLDALYSLRKEGRL